MTTERVTYLRIEQINSEMVRILGGLKKATPFRPRGYNEYSPETQSINPNLTAGEEEILRGRLTEAYVALQETVSELFTILFSRSVVQLEGDFTQNFDHFLDYYKMVIKVMEEAKDISMQAYVGGSNQFILQSANTTELPPTLNQIAPLLASIGFTLQIEHPENKA